MKIRKLVTYSIIIIGCSEMSLGSTLSCVEYYKDKEIKESVGANGKQLPAVVFDSYTHVLNEYVIAIIESVQRSRRVEPIGNEPFEKAIRKLKYNYKNLKTVVELEQKQHEFGLFVNDFLYEISSETRARILDATIYNAEREPDFKIPSFVVKLARDNASIYSMAEKIRGGGKKNAREPLTRAEKILDLDVTQKLKNLAGARDKMIKEIGQYLDRTKSLGVFKSGRERNELIENIIRPLYVDGYSEVGRISLFIEQLLVKNHGLPNVLRLPVKDVVAVLNMLANGILKGAFYDDSNIVELANTVKSVGHVIKYKSQGSDKEFVYTFSVVDQNVMFRASNDLLKTLEWQGHVKQYAKYRSEQNAESVVIPVAKKTKEELLEEAKLRKEREEKEAQFRKEREEQLAKEREERRIAEEARRKAEREREMQLFKEKREQVLKILQRKEMPEASVPLEDAISYGILKQETVSGVLKHSVSFGNMEDKGEFVNSGMDLVARLKEKFKNKRILIDADTQLGRALLNDKPDSQLVFVSRARIKDVAEGNQLFVIDNDFLRMEIFGATKMLGTPSSATAMGVYTNSGSVKFLTKSSFDGGYIGWSRELSDKNINLGVNRYNFDRVFSVKEMMDELNEGYGYKPRFKDESESKDRLPPIDFVKYLESKDSSQLSSLIRSASDFAQAIKGMRNVPGGSVVFGSSKNDAKYTKLVWEAVYELGKRGITVATGGSGGFMEVANDAAYSSGAHSIGIPIGGRMSLSTEKETKTSIQTMTISTSGYEQRIPFLLDNRELIIIAPGGSGTMKELGTAFLTLMKKERENDVLVLLGKDYYGKLYDTLKNSPLPESLKERIFLVNSKDDMAQLADKMIQTANDRSRLQTSHPPKPRNSYTTFKGIPYPSEKGFFESFKSDPSEDALLNAPVPIAVPSPTKVTEDKTISDKKEETAKAFVPQGTGNQDKPYKFSGGFGFGNFFGKSKSKEVQKVEPQHQQQDKHDSKGAE